MGKTRIDQILDVKPGIPLRLTFQNGEVQPGKESTLLATLQSNADGELRAALANDNLFYTGKFSTSNNRFDSYIVVRNKQTRKSKLIPVGDVLLKAEPPKQRAVLDSTQMEAIARRENISVLNKQFGSKRAKLHTEQLERLKVNVENVREELEKTIAEAPTEALELPKETSSTPSYMPPVNRNASTTDQVYNLNDLVPENVLNSLQAVATRVLQSEEEEEGVVKSKYVINQLAKLKNETAVNATQRASIYLYVDGLIGMAVEPARIISGSRYQPFPHSAVAGQYALDLFTQRSAKSRIRPLSMKDKTVCYILVLCMLAGRNMINLSALSESLRIGVKKLQEFCRVLLFSLAGDKNIATIKLPLPEALKGSPRKGSKRRK